MTKEELMALSTDDYQNRDGNYPKSGIPDSIDIYDNKNGTYDVNAVFKNTSEADAKSWLTKYIQRHKLTITKPATAWQEGDYHDDWVGACVIVKL